MKHIKQVLFQKRLVQKYNEDKVMELIPRDRLIIHYIEGEETEILHNGDLLDTPEQKPKGKSIDISKLKKDKMFKELNQILTKLINND